MSEVSVSKVKGGGRGKKKAEEEPMEKSVEKEAPKPKETKEKAADKKRKEAPAKKEKTDSKKTKTEPLVQNRRLGSLSLQLCGWCAL